MPEADYNLPNFFSLAFIITYFHKSAEWKLWESISGENEAEEVRILSWYSCSDRSVYIQWYSTLDCKRIFRKNIILYTKSNIACK